ncbi:MAG: undecaprenyl-diphosphatase UppP [Candidatus Kapaibacteriales bacterium]
MNTIEAFIIGLIQGLTEFLPISSTAHMTLFAKVFGADLLNNPQQWTAFMAVVQLGTLLSLLVYFYRDISHLISALLKLKRNSFTDEQFHNIKVDLIWKIILGSIPIFFFGYTLKNFIESDFTKSTLLIAVMLITIGLIMFFADKLSKKEKNINQINYIDTIVIGFAQAMALVPGVSRSGATISAGLFMGLKRESSAYYSFLLSIPAIAVSGLYEFVKYFFFFSSDLVVPTLIAFITSFVFGIISINFLLKYLKHHSTLIFVIYRIIVGLTLLIFFK